MRARLTPVLLAVALAVTLVSCAAGPQPRRSAPATDSPATVGADYTIPPCPELPRAEPVKGGLPALRLPCLGDGPAMRLSDLRGVPTVINVWAAWCVNCEREMPLFAEAVRAYGSEVRFLGIHYKAPRGYAEQSSADFGVPFPSVHDEDGDRVVRGLEAYAPPQTLFVDSSGRIVGRAVGEIRSVQELEGLIEKYLGVSA